LSVIELNNPKDFYVSEYTSKEAALEVLRQTEKRIEEQIQLSTAADQRAMTFLGLLVVVLALLYDKSPSEDVTIVGKASYAMLLVAVGFCAYSARPTRFFGSGSSTGELRVYLNDLSAGYTLSGLLDRTVKKAAIYFRVGMLVALVAFLMLFLESSGLADFVISHLPWSKT
jgi:hypothetical protein